MVAVDVAGVAVDGSGDGGGVGCAAGAVGVVAAGAGAGADAAGADGFVAVGVTAGVDFGAHATTSIPRATVVKTSDLMKGLRYFLSSIFCMRSISVDWSA